MNKPKNAKSWQATLARLVTEVQAKTKAPVPPALRDAFGERGFSIPVLAGNPDDRSGSVSAEDLEACITDIQNKKKES